MTDKNKNLAFLVIGVIFILVFLVPYLYHLWRK